MPPFEGIFKYPRIKKKIKQVYINIFIHLFIYTSNTALIQPSFSGLFVT